ncbi:MAG: MarC family protein [Candidatus Nanoarchaeia archaeon]|nr:MarC family protein [Candidatus Nanoarchaeia archaeon]
MQAESLIQLIILFAVIFDPLASFAVFLAASSKMKPKERRKTATYAILIALGLSLAVLILGETLLKIFSTNIDEFRVAGGIILLLLGIRMALGKSLTNLESVEGNSSKAVAALIGTPLLTGPAAITAILVSMNDYGRVMTGLAVLTVLFATGILFYQANRINKFVGHTTIQTMSTILGLITLAWGVKFIAVGVKAILLI